MKKPMIIVHSGGEHGTTHILYDGKAYGENITKVVFTHEAGEEAKIEFNLEGIDFEEMGKPADSLKDFITKILDENSPNNLNTIQDAVSKALNLEEKNKKLSFRIQELEKEMRK